MKFKEHLEEYEDLDIIDGDLDEKTVDDWGSVGKKFEAKMVRALQLAGLDFEENRYAGSGWDIKPKGTGWVNKLSGKEVNIKQAKTKWMFGSSELYKMLPWDGFKGDFDVDKAAKKVKRFIKKKGLDKIVYLKPNSPEIQTKIKDIADNNDKEKEAKEVLNKKNFYIEKLSGAWNVRVLTRSDDNGGGRVSSIAIDSGGKVFMRSEKPRTLGGTMMVTFRTPTHVPGKGTQGSVIK
jgi:hypothetical protein